MIYIQSKKDIKLPHHFDCACALDGAEALSMDYKLIQFEDVESGKLDLLIRNTNNTFVGSVEFMREVFNRVGIKDVRVPKNSNREHELITLKEAHERVANGINVFIKPLEIKLFTGLVLDGFKYSCLTGLPDDTIVMAYEPFDSRIQSEWRLYVEDDNIVDSRNYSGDFKINPSYEYAEEVVKKNEGEFPSAYTIDIGILRSTLNVVVEYNDMWAIGNYGIPNDMYMELLIKRYKEILINEQKNV